MSNEVNFKMYKMLFQIKNIINFSMRY